MVKIVTKLMTENDCYKAGRTIVPRGITTVRAAKRFLNPSLRTGSIFGTSLQASRTAARYAFMPFWMMRA